MKLVDANGAPAVDRHANPTLVKLLRQAHAWRRQLEGDNPLPISHLAAEHGVNSSYFTRILRLAYLAPDITEAILSGRQPADLTAARLLDNHDFPIEWTAQRSRLGFPAA